MKRLPLRGFARALARVAEIGLTLSVIAHLMTLLGWRGNAMATFEIGLFAGAVLVFAPAVIAQEILVWELSTIDRFRAFKPVIGRKIRNATIFFANPRWLRIVVYGIFGYAVAIAALTSYLGVRNSINLRDILLPISILPAVFYGAAMLILRAYSLREYRVSREEIFGAEARI
ncbi:hypothetical protein IMX07_09415 [bacterium]|nr:hypothetical protein [bacterium]